MEKQEQRQVGEESRGQGLQGHWPRARASPGCQMQSSWRILEEKAKKTDCCAEASEARDQGMAETEPKTGRLSRTLTMTTPLHRPPSKGNLLLVVSGGTEGRCLELRLQ